ncbi:MAG: glycosyltransferase family 4 protein [Thermosynechococcaceae cyanobacterium]
MNYMGVFIAIAFTLSTLLVKSLIGQFRQTLIDIPNERSSHTQPTPRGGGLGFILSFYTVAGLASILNPAKSPEFIWLILIPLILIGFLDDWKNLPASIRYLVQLSVSAIVITSLGAFPIISNQSTTPILEIGAMIVSIIAMTALINFYNFMDGLDGLVAGTALIQLSFLAFWSHNPSLWILVAALSGFLLWNWHPAKIFMGDSGSTFLGATIAVAILSKNTTPTDAWAALSITFPITADAIYTLSRRLLRRENIFQAHRSHLYQRLQQSGWSHGQVAIAYMAITLTMTIAILAYGGLGAVVSCFWFATFILLAEVYLHNQYPIRKELQ